MLQSISFICDDMQQVVTSVYPYLCEDSINGIVNGFDMQVLDDSHEENLNLLSFLIQFCNSDCINQEVVHKETIDFSVSKVLICTLILFLIRLCMGRFWHSLKFRYISFVRTEIKSSLKFSQITAASENSTMLLIRNRSWQLNFIACLLS